MISGRRSSAIGQYTQAHKDAERSVFFTGFPSNWKHECRLKMVSRFGAPEIFERVELAKHSRERGELAVFETNAQALLVQTLLDHMQINKHRLSAGPPPAWLQKKRNTFMPEDGDEAKQNRRTLIKILAPWSLSSCLLTGIFYRGNVRHKSVIVRVAFGYFYPLLVHILMIFSMYTCFEEALREIDSDEVGGAANAIQAFAFGAFLSMTEMVRCASTAEFLRPLSDNSLMRMAMLNVRPGTSDVAYFRKVVNALTVKGIVGVFLFVSFLVFPLWRENGGGGSFFFVARDPTPQLVLISVALIVASANVHVQFSRASLYSLVTRCAHKPHYKQLIIIKHPIFL